MRLPLRRQIMWPLLAVAVTSLATVGAIYMRLAERQTRQRIERQLQGVTAVLMNSNFPLSDTVLRQMRDLCSAEFVLVDEAGRLQASSLGAPPSLFPKSPLFSDSKDAALGPSLEIGGESYFHTTAVISDRRSGRGPQALHILFPEREYRRTWREAYVPPLVVGIAAVGAGAVAVQVIGSRLSRAASKLADDVLRMASGDFTPAELPQLNDEILDLSMAVNRTAAKLADYERQVRHAEQMRTISLLGAGLAHEMRNAATGCRMALDLHAEKCGASADDEPLTVAKRQLRLMESRLQRFLRAGKPLDDFVKQIVDFSSIIDDAVSLVGPSAKHAGIALKWTRPDSEILVAVDQEAMGQATLNLLINAIEAVQRLDGQQSREIAVCLQQNKTGNVELAVRDSGPGPSQALPGEVFDPFVTSKAEGVGLGLAATRQIVEAHLGQISWTRENEMTCFRILLPPALKGV